MLTNKVYRILYSTDNGVSWKILSTTVSLNEAKRILTDAALAYGVDKVIMVEVFDTKSILGL